MSLFQIRVCCLESRPDNGPTWRTPEPAESRRIGLKRSRIGWLRPLRTIRWTPEVTSCRTLSQISLQLLKRFTAATHQSELRSVPVGGVAPSKTTNPQPDGLLVRWSVLHLLGNMWPHRCSLCQQAGEAAPQQHLSLLGNSDAVKVDWGQVKDLLNVV